MKDRIVEHPNRYMVVPVEGSDSLVDLIPAPGEIVEEGTPLNKAALLRDATAAMLGLTSADPTVDEALRAIPDQIEPVGTIKTTMRTDLGDNWLLCNGDIIPKSTLYDILPDLDITNPVCWKMQYLLGTNKSPRILYDDGMWYAVYLVSGIIYLQETADLAESFSFPIPIMTVGFQGNTIDAIYHFKKLRDYYVFVLGCNGFVSIAYSSNIKGPYTHGQPTSAASAGYPAFIGCTDKLFYYVMSSGYGSNTGDGQEKLSVRYSTTIGSLGGACPRFDVDSAYAAYLADFQYISCAANNEYLVIGTTEHTKSASNTFSKSTKIYMVDLKNPSAITIKSSYSLSNNYGSSAFPYLVDGSFYVSFSYKSSLSGTSSLYLISVTESGCLAVINDSSAYPGSPGGPYFTKDGKLYQFNTTANALFVAETVTDMCKGVRTKYDLSYEGTSLSVSEVIATDLYVLVRSEASSAAFVCAKRLPVISLADMTYSYVRSD